MPILRSSHYSTFYGNMFCTLTFVSPDFLISLCLLSSCLCSPNNSSHCVLHNSQHGHTFCCFLWIFFFHLTERQAMILGHMSSLEGHASYKPLSVGKIAFFSVSYLHKFIEVYSGLFFNPLFSSHLSYSLCIEHTE